MNTVTIMLSSPSSAIKVKHILNRSNINARITKLEIEETGCTYGVKIDDSYLIDAISLLRSHNIKYTVKQES